MYMLGHASLSDVATIASFGILGLVARKAAEYDTKLIVPVFSYIAMPIAQEIVREAHYAVGRPDSFDKNNVFFLTDVQFAYVAGVNGIMIRERAATNFFLGYFTAEALLMTETGNSVGSVQIAGTDAVTQIPFFITTCDYTLIGEEFYAASAYLNREPMQLGTLKAQDYFKFFVFAVVIVGAILSTFQITVINNLLPLK
jgi:sulfur relay (sulfurtransferase) DsrF/TusC family protein